MYDCRLNVYGIHVVIKAKNRRELSRLRRLYRLFLVPQRSVSEPDTVCCNQDELDLISLLASKLIFAFHAAGYENCNGKGILLPAKTACGKTTIAFSALSSGHSFVGDDIVLCRRNKQGIQLLPFKGYLLIKQASETQAYSVLDNHAREVFSLPYAQLIVFPKIVAQRSTELFRIHDKKETFFKLLGTMVWAKDHETRKKQEAMIKTLCALPAYELNLGSDHRKNPEIAIELLDRI